MDCSAGPTAAISTNALLHDLEGLGRPFRVGVMCGDRLTEWQSAVLDALTSDGLAELQLVIRNDSPRRRDSKWRRLWDKQLLWNLYNNYYVAARSRVGQRVQRLRSKPAPVATKVLFALVDRHDPALCDAEFVWQRQ